MWRETNRESGHTDYDDQSITRLTQPHRHQTSDEKREKRETEIIDALKE